MEIFRQLPRLTTALKNGLLQLVLRDEFFYCPFVGPVFIFLTDIPGGVTVVKCPGLTVAQFMGQLDRLVGHRWHPPGIHSNGAGAVGQGHRQGFGGFQIEPDNLCAVILGQAL